MLLFAYSTGGLTDVLNLILSLFRPNHSHIVRVRKFEMAELRKWMRGPGNPDHIGRGYVGNRLINATGAYVDVHRKQTQAGWWQITASLVVDPRQGSAATQTWYAEQLDHQISQQFGINDRFRIRI